MRQRIQRMLTAAVGLLLLLSASGCGFSFSPTDLYSLPQLPEEYTELNSSRSSSVHTSSGFFFITVKSFPKLPVLLNQI